LLQAGLRSQIGRLGAHTLHALYDSRELTRNGRAAAATALEQRLLSEVDPDNKLSLAERERRLGHARKAHFQRLALRSAQARRKAGAGHE
jgi:hypothetical protein